MSNLPFVCFLQVQYTKKGDALTFGIPRFLLSLTRPGSVVKDYSQLPALLLGLSMLPTFKPGNLFILSFSELRFTRSW